MPEVLSGNVVKVPLLDTLNLLSSGVWTGQR